VGVFSEEGKGGAEAKHMGWKKWKITAITKVA